MTNGDIYFRDDIQSKNDKFWWKQDKSWLQDNSIDLFHSDLFIFLVIDRPRRRKFTRAITYYKKNELSEIVLNLDVMVTFLTKIIYPDWHQKYNLFRLFSMCKWNFPKCTESWYAFNAVPQEQIILFLFFLIFISKNIYHIIHFDYIFPLFSIFSDLFTFPFPPNFI